MPQLPSSRRKVLLTPTVTDVQPYVELIEATVSRGLGGLHHYVGIPSTVWGAVWQNLHFLSPAPEREREAPTPDAGTG